MGHAQENEHPGVMMILDQHPAGAHHNTAATEGARANAAQARTTVGGKPIPGSESEVCCSLLTAAQQHPSSFSLYLPDSQPCMFCTYQAVRTQEPVGNPRGCCSARERCAVS